MIRFESGQIVTPFRAVPPARALALIVALTVAIYAGLMALIYWNKGRGGADDIAWMRALPALNAALNGLSAVLLSAAWIAVRRRRLVLHFRLIVAAVVSSGLFLVSYLLYHWFHADTTFLGTGWVRPVYFGVLISHIVLSGVALFLIMTSLYFALAGRWARHRAVSRWTMPVWLYVSVTGVLIFVMLKVFNPVDAGVG